MAKVEVQIKHHPEHDHYWSDLGIGELRAQFLLLALATSVVKWIKNVQEFQETREETVISTVWKEVADVCLNQEELVFVMFKIGELATQLRNYPFDATDLVEGQLDKIKTRIKEIEEGSPEKK